MKHTATSLALALALVWVATATATAGQYSSEFKRGPKQREATSRSTTSVDHATPAAVGQYAAQLDGPKTKTRSGFKAKTEEPSAGTSSSTKTRTAPTRRLAGQHSDNGIGPKA